MAFSDSLLAGLYDFVPVERIEKVQPIISTLGKQINSQSSWVKPDQAPYLVGFEVSANSMYV